MKIKGKEIKGIIFDLDGTLIDSCSIWHEVDHDFFAKRNMELPSGYAEAIGHMGLDKAAIYTINEYHLNEKKEDIINEWKNAVLDKYAHHVFVKEYVKEFLDSKSKIPKYDSIFELYKKVKKADNSITKMCYDYSDSIDKWWEFAEHIDEITKENNTYICDYSKSMEIVKNDVGEKISVSFPIESQYIDNGNYVNIGDWVWRRKDGQTKFAFDSDAERTWADFLKELATDDTDEENPRRVAQRVEVGKRNPLAEEQSMNLEGDIIPSKINPSKKYLWGKNYPVNSNIKFEYCLDGTHFSYPDFILKDVFGRIHLFEVKSVNISSSTPAKFDSDEYKSKVEELKRCYKQASLLTGYIFYLPVLKDDVWHITRLLNGEEDNITATQFTKFFSIACFAKQPYCSISYSKCNQTPKNINIEFEINKC